MSSFVQGVVYCLAAEVGVLVALWAAGFLRVNIWPGDDEEG